MKWNKLDKDNRSTWPVRTGCEQNILTYCEPTGTFDHVLINAGDPYDFDDGFAIGVTYWANLDAETPSSPKSESQK